MHPLKRAQTRLFAAAQSSVWCGRLEAKRYNSSSIHDLVEFDLEVAVFIAVSDLLVIGPVLRIALTKDNDLHLLRDFELAHVVDILNNDPQVVLASIRCVPLAV